MHRFKKVIDYQHPQQHNPRFTNLPRKYPERTKYETLVEAEADGWININPGKYLVRHNDRIIYVRDVTPGRSYGYNLAWP